MIVVATANGYYRPEVLPRAGRGPMVPREAMESAERAISFTIHDVLKGEWPGPRQFTLDGKLVADDKAEPPDASTPRRHARGNACVATTYVSGEQYLLIFKRIDGGLAVDWAPLSPSNERIRGAADPWLAWVRTRVERAPHVESR